MTHRLRAALGALVLATPGCGPAESTGPRTTLTEKDQQQVKDLQQQRQDEWGKGKKK